MASKPQHFLIVTFAAQGQINPACHLARRLAQIAQARVTLSFPLSTHRRLFPKSSASAGDLDDDADEPPLNPNGSGFVSYAPHSDGYDQGYHPDTLDIDHFMKTLKSHGSRSLAALASGSAAAGRPITCILYATFATWAADVARSFGIPSVLYWTQPASVFSVYYHYFHGHPGFAGTSHIELPGLPALRKKDLPSVMRSADDPFASEHREMFAELDKSSAPLKILVNTIYELEAGAIDRHAAAELVAIGPVTGEGSKRRDLFEEDAGDYMKWLDAQEERDVVYVAFGSWARMSEEQVGEMARGLRESGRPYLWALRRDSRPEGFEGGGDGRGMVVEWCSQMSVLRHKAVGCFVTHGGWNSTIEAVSEGVPMVMMPQWADQATNARLAEAQWGIGIRAEQRGDGIVEAAELRRLLDLVMGEGESSEEIRKRAEKCREMAVQALAEDGSSSKNLAAFVCSLRVRTDGYKLEAREAL